MPPSSGFRKQDRILMASKGIKMRWEASFTLTRPSSSAHQHFAICSTAVPHFRLASFIVIQFTSQTQLATPARPCPDHYYCRYYQTRIVMQSQTVRREHSHVVEPPLTLLATAHLTPLPPLGLRLSRRTRHRLSRRVSGRTTCLRLLELT